MIEYDKQKLRLLAARRDQLNSVTADLSERLRLARTELKKAQQHAARAKTGEGFARARELSVDEFERIDDLGAEVDLLDNELCAARERLAYIDPVVRGCEGWLKGSGARRGGEYPAPTPPKDVAKTKKSLDQLRAEIDSLTEQRTAIEEAPLPRNETLGRIESWIAARASEFHLGGLANQFPIYENPIDAAALRISKVATPFTENTSIVSFDLAPALCALLPEQLKASLAAELNTDDKQAIPATARSDKLHKINDQLHALEIEEEMLVSSLEAAGEFVYRRTGFKPEIVLAARETADAPKPYVSRQVPVQKSRQGSVR